MTTLSLKNVKMVLPSNLSGTPSSENLAEWLSFELGQTDLIKASNPLYDIYITDCKISVGEVEIDGQPFDFNYPFNKEDLFRIIDDYFKVKVEPTAEDLAEHLKASILTIMHLNKSTVK